MQKTEKEEINMPILSGITKNIKTLGKVGGFAYALQHEAQVAGTDFGSHIQHIMTEALRSPHFPNIGHVIYDLTKNPTAVPLKNAIMLFLAGEVLDMTGLVKGKWPKLMKDVGKNAAIGVAAYSVIKHATIWRSPGGPIGSTTIGENFASAPKIGVYNEY